MDTNVNAALIVAGATIFAALLALLGGVLGVHRTAKRTAAKTDALGKKADVLVENVQNSHPLPLRDDMDAQLLAITQLVTKSHEAHSADLRQLRAELSADREESRSDIRSINRRMGQIAGRVFDLERKKKD